MKTFKKLNKNMIYKFAFLILILTIPYTMGQNCNRICLPIWRPVCAGSPSMRVQCTFTNSCFLGVRQCRRPLEGKF